MEQNYQYDQGNTYGNQLQYSHQYPAQMPGNQQWSAEQIVAAYADEAFGKSLASAIMSQFPVASFFAIGFGHKGLKLVDQARAAAAYYGISAGGKATAAKVLGTIGKIAGIVYSVIWSLYAVIYAIYFLLLILMAFA